MTFHINADTLDDIHELLIQDLVESPDYEAAPRGQKVKELIGASFTLNNPRARLIASKVRNVNYGFAVGEFCWYARGDNDLTTMAYYNKRMPGFSDDGETLNSAYGRRILGEYFGNDGSSQWESVLEELKRDSDSRRAIMVINQPRDLAKAVSVGSKDVPCTLALQLLIRDRKLHLSVTMRSNDVWWGLPYDVFSFTLLQECFMMTLRREGVPVDDVGRYHHHAGSLHLYERHFKEADEVIKETSLRLRCNPMEPLDIERTEKLVHESEPYQRNADPDKHIVNNFTGAEDWMFQVLLDHREKRLKENK